MKRNETLVNPNGTEMERIVSPAEILQREKENCKDDRCSLVKLCRICKLEEENIKILRILDEAIVNNINVNH